MEKILKPFAVMVVILSLAGCQAMTGRTAGQNIDDAAVTASVKSKLVADRISSLTRVDVDTTSGTVYLNGVVESPDQKARVGQLASQVSGVNNVVNDLQVQKQ